MSDDPAEPLSAADRVLAFAAELEASGDNIQGAKLERARALLHKWVDSTTNVVTIPAFGRVTLIHEDGTESTINSADLAFAISVPVARSQDS